MTGVEVKKVINQLLSDPENQKCADCKVSAHPRWSSWSLGVLVCIRCAGFHRSLGTHISKIKSIDLDIWKEENLKQLVYFENNRNANQFYEAGLGGGTYVPDQSKIGQFIRTKYELKKWQGSHQEESKNSSSAPIGVSSPESVTRPSSTANSSVKREDCSLLQSGTSPKMSVQVSENSASIPIADSRPDLKRSILSLYSRSKPLLSSSVAPTPSSSSPSFNNTSISLDDNDFFKNVWS